MYLGRMQLREIDRRAIDEYGMSGLVLMENAGSGVADRLAAIVGPGPVAVCCGKGKNGGDGFVIARHLDARSVDVRVLVWAEPSSLAGNAAENFHIVAKSGIPLDVFGQRHDDARLAAHLAGARYVVDALLGTGAQGDPRPPLAEVIDSLNNSKLPIFAIDVPSGLDCDTGRAAPSAIRATKTYTFVAPKRGFATPRAKDYTGEVEVLQIGAPRRLVAEVLSASPPETATTSIRAGHI
jgi:NAD(P)H-hydrate epimerase